MDPRLTGIGGVDILVNAAARPNTGAVVAIVASGGAAGPIYY